LLHAADIALLPLVSRLYRRYDVEVSVLRLDQVHPLVSGNKWFKLKPALTQALALQRPVLSFGGAWSNHIHALAYAGWQAGIKTVGIIRGEPEYAANAMLSDAQRWGMQLEFVDRSTYRLRDCRDFQRQLASIHGGALVVPEGGSSAAAVHSVAEIWQLPCLQNQPIDLLLTAVGSGGTLAGLVAGKPARTHVLGVPVLKWGDEMPIKINALLEAAGYAGATGWSLLGDAHRGGYARLDAELAALIEALETRHRLPLDPVYTAKLVMAFNRLLLAGQVAAGSRVVLVHSGGLQGVRGQQQRLSSLAPAFNGPLTV
jgi:1-aminocyclopropane-1-carboxylate deaminase